MPYIKPSDRDALDEEIHALATKIENEGELNYAITKLCIHYLWMKTKKYATFNTVIGVLECAKQEMYRRAVGPFEDDKRNTNGDVY